MSRRLSPVERALHTHVPGADAAWHHQANRQIHLEVEARQLSGRRGPAALPAGPVRW